MYRMLDEAARRGARPHLRAGVGVGRRCHAARAGASASRRWAPPSPCRCSAPWARRCSPRATAWSRSAAGWPPRCHRRSSAPARARSARRSASRCPATRCGSSTTTGAELKGGQVGELQVKGPGVLKAYWGDDAATHAVLTEDGWLRTGDLARRGPLGLLVFEGRQKHVIKHGGYSVYALEVEQVLEQHPDVLEASVVGLPDDRLGEIPAAAVRLAEGATLEPADLRGVGQRAAGRLQGPQALGRGRRAAAHRHREGPEVRARRPLRRALARRRRRGELVDVDVDPAVLHRRRVLPQALAVERVGDRLVAPVDEDLRPRGR